MTEKMVPTEEMALTEKTALMAKTEEMESTEKMPFIPMTMERKSSPVLQERLASQGLLDLPEKRETLERLAHLVEMAKMALMELPDTMALPVLKVPQANLVSTDHLAPMEKMVPQVKRERMAPTELLVSLVPLDFLAKTATPEGLDLKGQRVKLEHLASPSHPTSLDPLAHLATLAKMANQASTALPDLLAPLDHKDLKVFLANQEALATQDILALKAKLVKMAYLEPQARTDILAHLARSLAHLVPLDLLAHRATMAALVKTVQPALLVTQAKMESQDLQDTQVKFGVQKFAE